MPDANPFVIPEAKPANPLPEENCFGPYEFTADAPANSILPKASFVPTTCFSVNSPVSGSTVGTK